MTKSRKHCGKSKGRGRGKRGGSMVPLSSSDYMGSTGGAGHWSTSVADNPVAQAAGSYQSLLGKIAADSGGAGANPALAREMLASYAMKGGGSRRHKRHGNHSKRMRRSQAQAQSQGQAQAQSQGQAQAQSQGQAQAQAQGQAQRQSQGQAQRQSQGQAQRQSQGQSQSGGMFATFGALLKEALVPLGLLAAQQAYGRSYGKKNRTRKNRK